MASAALFAAILDTLVLISGYEQNIYIIILLTVSNNWKKRVVLTVSDIYLPQTRLKTSRRRNTGLFSSHGAVCLPVVGRAMDPSLQTMLVDLVVDTASSSLSAKSCI